MVASKPAQRMNASVGPLSTSPPTIGETATIGAGLSSMAWRISGTASIGPIEITGLDGPMTIAVAVASASRISGVGSASSTPRSWVSRTVAAGVLAARRGS